MALTATVTPGHQFAESDPLTIPNVNLLGQPTIAATGTLDGLDDVVVGTAADGQIIVYDSGTGKWVNRDAGVINQTFRNLRAYPNSAHPTYQIDVAADNILLSGPNNASLIARTFAATIDASTTGVNGLDTGSMAAGWYYVWCISNGTLFKGMLSLQDNQSDVLTNMPTGYTYRARIGAVYCTSGDPLIFRRFHIRDHETVQDRVIFELPKSATALVLTGAQLTTFLTAVPPRASACCGIVGTITAHDCQVVLGMAAVDGGVPSDHATEPPLDENALCIAKAANYVGDISGAAGGWYAAGRFEVKLWPGVRGATLQNIVYRTRDATPTYYMSITGYTI